MFFEQKMFYLSNTKIIKCNKAHIKGLKCFLLCDSKSREMKRFLGILCLAVAVNGHGRLIEPPSRASMWRYGFDNPPDWNDNQGYCGGFSVIDFCKKTLILLLNSNYLY